MKILMSNDDGIYADGIRQLAAAFSGENEVVLSAPDRERSAASNGMTLIAPLRAKRVKLSDLPDVRAYAVDGTPVDCVRLGLGNLFPEAELVLSGVNHGANTGTDTLYSGTVAAAHEAAQLGVPAVAVSINSFIPEHWETAVHYAKAAVRYIARHPMPAGTVLNVNVPDLPLEEVRGLRLARLGVVRYALAFLEKKDPIGETYYWPPRARLPYDGDPAADYALIKQGYAVMTPLTCDLTDERTLLHMRETESEEDCPWTR